MFEPIKKNTILKIDVPTDILFDYKITLSLLDFLDIFTFPITAQIGPTFVDSERMGIVSQTKPGHPRRELIEYILQTKIHQHSWLKVPRILCRAETVKQTKARFTLDLLLPWGREREKKIKVSLGRQS